MSDCAARRAVAHRKRFTSAHHLIFLFQMESVIWWGFSCCWMRPNLGHSCFEASTICVIHTQHPVCCLRGIAQCCTLLVKAFITFYAHQGQWGWHSLCVRNREVLCFSQLWKANFNKSSCLYLACSHNILFTFICRPECQLVCLGVCLFFMTRPYYSCQNISRVKVRQECLFTSINLKWLPRK